jgi:Zn-dependent protease
VRWSFRIGTVGGISVRIHVTFLLFVAWIALDQWRKSGRIEEAITAVALALSVFGCVLLHELGHAFAARRYGIRTRDIVLFPIGGVAASSGCPKLRRSA